jgi:hypothetical protein
MNTVEPRNATCKICGGAANPKFAALVMGRYNGSFSHCKACGFLQADNPDWLEAAYREPINLTDTGLVRRNLLLSRITAVIIFYLFDKKGAFVDYGGGYGLFTRLMRDIGLDFYWLDPYARNLLSRGFEYGPEKGRLELLTAFEVFEHLANPLEEIEKMVGLCSNILFSTALLPRPIPHPEQWWYYGLEHGQHVSFYSPQTLSWIASRFGLVCISAGMVHLLTKRRELCNPLSIIERGLRRIDQRFFLRTSLFRHLLPRDFSSLVNGADVLFHREVTRGLVSKTDSDSEMLGAVRHEL